MLKTKKQFAALILGIFLFAGAILPTIAFAQDDWPLGLYDGRSWERIEVDGATSGGGTPYAFFFSPASRPEGKYHLTIYFPGGGSTRKKADGSVYVKIKWIEEIRTLMNVGSEPGGNKRLFMDHPDNDAFIGTGHWVIIPYTTQDRYIGRRSDAEVYDITNIPNNKIKKQAEIILNQGISTDSLEQYYPGLKIIEVEGTPGNYQIKKLELHIIHRGALNVNAANHIIFNRIKELVPDFRERGKIMVSGGSAGGMGAWYNFYKYGDFLYDYPATQLTLAPMGGSPFTKVWSDAVEDLVVDEEQVAAINHRFQFYQAIHPCEIAGGAHTPSPDDDCTDVLQLLDHYRLQRYPDKDIRFAPVANKEDLVLASSISGDEDKLLNLIKTVHRYSQYMGQKADTYPCALWLFLNEESNTGEYKRVHVPEKAAILSRLLNMNDENRTGDYSVLGFLNALAARKYQGPQYYIEYMPGIVWEPNNPSSLIVPYTKNYDKFMDGNVPWPTTHVHSSPTIPQEINFLHQNYPNPFNPTTTISYQLPVNADVSLKVYNMLGQEVRTLINENKPAGEHSVVWNGKDSSGQQVTSGIYFYSLKLDNNYSITNRMLLLK